MRLKGTKYEKIEKLPKDALTCTEYAKKHDLGSGAYVQVKYDRFIEGYKGNSGNMLVGEDPGYQIRCWHGMNFVIPKK